MKECKKMLAIKKKVNSAAPRVFLGILVHVPRLGF